MSLVIGRFGRMKRILCQLVVGLLAARFVVVSASWVSAQEATVLIARSRLPANRSFVLRIGDGGAEFDVADGTAGTRSLLKSMIVEVLPAEFEETKKWGGTKKVWDGLHVRMDGLQRRPNAMERSQSRHVEEAPSHAGRSG